MNDHVLFIIGLSIGSTNFILLLVVLWSKWYIRSEFVESMVKFRSEASAHYDETLALLRATRGLAEGARDNRKETAVAVESAKGEIKAVPEKTAALVVEKLPNSSDDWRGHEHKPH